MSHRNESRLPTQRALARDRTKRWRGRERPDLLRELVRRTDGLQWSPQLLALLIEELNVEDEFVALIAEPVSLAARQYPQAVAVALALRHSWRPDDFRQFLKELSRRRRGKG
jgi:hypothetical protein